jgi:hypothetical protein
MGILACFMSARGVWIPLNDASSCKVSKLIACLVTIRWWAPLGIALRVTRGPRCGWTRVGVAVVWRSRGGWEGMTGMGSMIVACGLTPGKLLRVTRRWRRGVVRKLRLAVGFLVRIIGEASVMRGNVSMGDSSITLCSSSRASCCWSNHTLCSSKIGGDQE